MTSREKFEAWVKFHLDDKFTEVPLYRGNGGLNYLDSQVDLAWIAWQAAETDMAVQLANAESKRREIQRDNDSLEAVAVSMRDDMRDAREKLEAAEKRIAELESRTVTVKLPNGDRDIAAFRIDPTEGPSWLTFRCEEDLRKNGVIGEFDSVVPLSVITSDAPKRGEVVVTVSGLTGSGKSAIAGEIEIAMRAIGVPVHWMNGGAEKRMTGADWLTAIEMYKPTVRIVEVNVPRAAGIGVKGE